MWTPFDPPVDMDIPCDPAITARRDGNLTIPVMPSAQFREKPSFDICGLDPNRYNTHLSTIGLAVGQFPSRLAGAVDDPLSQFRLQGCAALCGACNL